MGKSMWIVWTFLAIILIIGNLLILLRTAKKPKVPDMVKPQPYEAENDDNSAW
jgi:NADH:ubiquinone oxidoreductase subunit 3 (subunit A)